MKILLPAVLAFSLLINCNQHTVQTKSLEGKAQGTTWHITLLADNISNYKEGIDSILNKIDSSLSTYVPTSVISRINQNDTGVIVDDYFLEVFNKSMDVSGKTWGLFDITVAPVVNAWGFGFSNKAAIDSNLVDSLLDFVGYEMVRLEGRKLVKEKPAVMLDFNAIAQGYTVDVLAAYMESKGINNYLVELGGEVKASGKKNNKNWTVGIDQPNENNNHGRPLQAIIQLTEKALATSGNYRKFYVENGQRYAHIIDPFTGYPSKQNLLSATVIANDCMTADAYATAFMVMGKEKSIQFLSEHPELHLEVFFIYDENGAWKTYSSETLKALVEEMH